MKNDNYLTTNEFVKKVKELGFRVVVYESNCVVIHGGDTIANVDNFTPMQLSNYYYAYDKLCNEDKEKLLDLIIDYASTPIEKREEEKKYYLKHRWIKGTCNNYLNFCKDYTKYFINNKAETNTVKTQFTRKEINEIKEKFNTDLSDFEEDEVEE